MIFFTVRKFQIEDAEEVSALIAKTLRKTNMKDYSSEYIENDVKKLSPSHIIERANCIHFYVACDEDVIIGCGAIIINDSKILDVKVFPCRYLKNYVIRKWRKV